MRYRFDGFVLDTKRFELSQRGQAVHAEPQVVELLVLLIENRNRMVSKQEIHEAVWRGRVVSEASLSSRIRTARKILGDNGRDQRIIRTIHKKGFRFVAELSEDESSSQETLVDHKPSTSHTKPAIAVLPFSNLSSHEGQEYLSDGITTDIITHLSKYRWLGVTARNNSFGYKNSTLDGYTIGRELEVDYLVEGTVQQAGKRIRVSAHLVDTRSRRQLWADRFDRELSDIFELQDELTGKIVARLEPEIGMAERSKVILARPANLQAWDSYHLGIYHFFKFTGADNLEAQRLLLQSQQQDSKFGEPFAWWAYAVILGMVYWDVAPTQTTMDKALHACNIALSLDSQNATFYALKARVLLARKEYDLAIAENEIAISLNPTLAAAHCGLGDSLAYEGRYEESVACFDRAIALSSNDPQLWAFYTYGALTLIFKQDYERALIWAERAASIPNSQYWTAAHRLVALTYLGREQEMEQARVKLLTEQPGFTLSFAREKLFYLRRQEQIDMYITGLERAGISEV